MPHYKGAKKDSSKVIIYPEEFSEAFRNPLKGFRGKFDDWKYGKYSTLVKTYIKWNEIENSQKDNEETIRAYCDNAWSGIEEKNIKVIPRIYLAWPNHGDHTKATEVYKYWPEDMEPGDYSSKQFEERVVRLIEKLSPVWDNDPRVGYIEMGIIGLWGEQHDPCLTDRMQEILGTGFTNAFKNKLIMVRKPWDFKEYRFGIYWDSFAHLDEENYGLGIFNMGERWKYAVMGGEAAYNWGNYEIQPGDNPDDSLRDPMHFNYIMTNIKKLHANHLGWISDYSTDEGDVLTAADKMQKELGYRFVIQKVEYNAEVKPGGCLEISFDVKNTGSSPLYYNWPVELSLLDKSKRIIWSKAFDNIDLRTWIPGDFWDEENKVYRINAPTITIKEKFEIPTDIPTGEYIVALAVLDPAGNLPCVRFAIKNYFNGGRHPIGLIGIGCEIENPELNNSFFDSIKADESLYYVYKK